MDLNSYLHPSIIASLEAGGYLLMLGLMIVEGPIVTFIAAFLASLGVFDIRWVLFLGFLGDMGGDIIFFLIGRYGWKILSGSTGVNTKKEKKFIEKLDSLIEKNLFLSIFIIKFTPYAPPIGIAYIGKIGTNPLKYFVYSSFFSLTIPCIIGTVGYHIQGVNTILRNYQGIDLIYGVVFILISIFLLVWGYAFLRRKSRELLER